jgi:hypothetical protein
MRNPFRGWRAGLFRLLRVFAPEGSNLDAVFGSYDDWKKFRPKGLDSKAESIAATKPK